MRPMESNGEVVVSMPSGRGFFYSHDGGASRHAAASGLPAGEMVLGLAARGDTLFAGTSENGILVSWDKGRSWRAIEPVLPASGEISDLIIRDSSLYAVGDGGVWRLPLPALK
jgi:hypothetical protein